MIKKKAVGILAGIYRNMKKHNDKAGVQDSSSSTNEA